MNYTSSLVQAVKFACLTCLSMLAFQVPMVNAENPMAVAWAQEGEQWLSFKSEHFEINYLSENRAQAARAATIAENAWIK